MSCCDGCATKTGCETGCAGGGCGVSCAGGGCGAPQAFYAPPNTGCAPPWLGGPAAGCAAHAAVPPLFGREVAPWLVSAGTGQLRAAPRGNIFAPSPAVPQQYREITRGAVITLSGAALFTDFDRLQQHGYRPDLAMSIPGGTIVEKIGSRLYHVQEPGRPWQGWSYEQVRVPSFGLVGFVRWNDLQENQFSPDDTPMTPVPVGTGQVVRTAPFRMPIPPFVDVLAPATPPFAVQPAPPPIVTRQPLFRAVVAVPTGEPGVNIRAAATSNAPLVGVAHNGQVLDVYTIGIPQADGACPRCQWWHVAGFLPADDTSPPLPPPLPGPPPSTGQFSPGYGFVRAIGPQGEWNLRRTDFGGGWPRS